VAGASDGETARRARIRCMAGMLSAREGSRRGAREAYCAYACVDGEGRRRPPRTPLVAAGFVRGDGPCTMAFAACVRRAT
jgi:hypothetical protein